MTKQTPVVTRFAPSPTGRLHIGGARTALFNWALARGAGGKFLLRIEDTDQARSSDAATTQILQSLAWLGIDWDEGPTLTQHGRTIGGDARSVGPFFQSQRLDSYRAASDRLLDLGRAYHAFETTEELEAKRQQAIAAKKQYRYDRAALDVPEMERRRRAAAGEPHVIRFRMPDTPVTVRDEVRGEVVVQPEELEDFVIIKGDGFPTYHFAVVVDDEAMGVTHVIRGQEHLSNTPKHVALQHALGFPTPVYAHLPLIFGDDGGKMSKRDKDKALRAYFTVHKTDPENLARFIGADDERSSAQLVELLSNWFNDTKSQLPLDILTKIASVFAIDLPEIDVTDFDEAGYLPEVVCNYLALLGWSPGDDVEKFDLSFLSDRFRLDRIVKTNAKFDRNKLLAFNTDAIAQMAPEQFHRTFVGWCARQPLDVAGWISTKDESWQRVAAEAVRPRSKTLREAARSLDFVGLIIGDSADDYDPKAVAKWIEKDDRQGIAVLRDLRERLGALEPFNPERIHALVESYAAEGGLGMGKVAQPLRVAMTGTSVSPPIDATLAILGKATVLARIDRCLETLASRV